MARITLEGHNYNVRLLPKTEITFPDITDYYVEEGEQSYIVCIAFDTNEIVDLDKDLQDENVPFGGPYLLFHYANDDVLGFYPILDGACYGKGYDEIFTPIVLSQKEHKTLQKILTDAIGDKHTPKMRQTMVNYHNSIDKEILYFVKNIRKNRKVFPITVGFVSEKMASEISKLTGLDVVGNRIRLDESAVRHIINRHGAHGKANISMSAEEDIARMSYILSNFDNIEWDGGTTSRLSTKNNTEAPCIRISKRINGVYYVVEAVSDSKKSICSIVSAYLTKATT